MKQAEIFENINQVIYQLDEGLINQVEFLDKIAELGIEWIQSRDCYEIDRENAISLWEFNQKLGL